MILNQKELEAIIAGEWIVDCPGMSLVPARADIESYEGAGYIKQDKDYRLQFKLISAQKTGFSFMLDESTQAGQLYAPEEYWRLVAKDVHGREWTSERILPDVLHDEGTVATGTLRDLTVSELNDSRDDPHAIKLWFLGNYEITCNQPKITTIKIGDEEVISSGEWNHGEITIGQRRFIFRKERDWLFFEVSDPARNLQPFLANRIEESLEFVLGRPVRATLLLRNGDDLCCLQIRSVAPAPKDDHAKPPYPPPIKDREAHFWHLFGLHLKHIERHGSLTRAPLSRAWQYFIDSRSSALEIRALSLGVGIEALLRVVDPTMERIASPQLEAARNYISAADLDESVKKRLLGAIEGMTQMSTSDKLHQLVERRIISRSQFKAWKRIRNRAAHARDFSIDDTTISDCNLVLTAAHRIVFDVLGYGGTYMDYGVPGWPLSTFPEAGQ